jgi:hypothetical protein
MQLDQTVETFGNEDQSWLGSAHGTDATKTATLAVSLFTAGVHYPSGYFPSGLSLGKVTANNANKGLYGPYDNTATDGREVYAGPLFTTIRAPRGTVTSTTRVQGAILKHGSVRVSRLPIPAEIDAGARADAAGRILFED